MRLGWVSAADRLDKSAGDKGFGFGTIPCARESLNAQPPSQNLRRGRRSTSIIGCAAENPTGRQTGTFYILCLRDFEILGARDVKRDERRALDFFGRVFGFRPFKSVDDG